MYIKKIVIQGFKTYKDTTVIEDLTPHFNVVVGKNGSGKSNFFSAIRFVLSDAYTHMTREERHGLIHEGTATVMSAYVEIIFDNQDRRFPIQKDEISVRRTIGLKKDDYSLDGKSSTRSDIMNLLESAGFSRSNPYYIVPQGKITSLTNSKDTERLQLLKEVSGAKMFETKLKESSKEMSTSQFKMDRIDESMEKLHQKLSDLQLESDQLKQFRALEKNKKVLEFNLFDRELNSINTQIEALDEKYEAILTKSHDDISALDTRENMCSNLQSSMSDLESRLKIISLELAQSTSDQKRVMEAIVSKEATKSTLENSLGYSTEIVQEESDKIRKYNQLIATNNQELSEQLAQLEPLKTQESELRTKLSEASSTQRALFSKKGRYQQFASKNQRDEWLKTELATLKTQISDREAKSNMMYTTIKEKSVLVEDISCRLEELSSTLENETQQKTIDDLVKRVSTLKTESITMGKERKALLREEIKFKALRDSAEHDLTNINSRVTKMMNSAQLKALEAVSEVTARLGMSESVYGPLVELFSVSDKYKTAVEVIAGSSLFHVVVDTDESASVLMQELAKMKMGKLTFMPLNRMKARQQNFPKQEGQDFIPLMKKIKVSHSEVEVAIAHVFGQTVICSNLQRGSELARQHGLNAITLDGDRVSSKGLLSGGFRQQKSSRFDNFKLQRKKREALQKVVSQLKNVTTKIKELDIRIQEASSRLESTTSELEEQRNALQPHQAEELRLVKEKSAIELEISSAKFIQESDLLALSQLNSKHEQYQEELNSEFLDGLSVKDSERLEAVSIEIASVEEEFNKISGEVTTLETTISERRDNITNLEAQIRKLEDISLAHDAQEKLSELKSVSDDLAALQEQLPVLNQALEKAESERKELQDKFDRENEELEQLNNQQRQLLKKIEDTGKQTEKVLSKKALLHSRRDELHKMIQSLGVLPEEAFHKETFENSSLNDIYESLNTVNVELREYSHINKKALEQYNIFNREKEELIARKEELEASRASIESLVKSLEQQKDSAILKSFEEVSRKFSEVFGQLVPNGRGELIMRHKESEEQSPGDSIESYMGVSILVSFNSKDNEQQYIEQLSGGQKSLCAISLILAIQKCDPAPFYLFDEIDANLDTQYRTAVASLISSLAANAQFICTTFRPEMLQAASKFYGVSYGEKVSTVSEITQDEALSFVEAQR